MKILLTLLIIGISLSADVKQKMFTLYQDAKYEQACKVGFKYFQRYVKDESYVSLYAYSCLKADYIDRLSMPISVLRYTEESRANAAYFSVILMQKKLLYHAMLDNYDISTLNLPSTDYVLSKVFDLYTELKKHNKKQNYLFTDKKDSKLQYKLYVVKENNVRKIIIEEIYDNISIKRHVYW